MLFLFFKHIHPTGYLWIYLIALCNSAPIQISTKTISSAKLPSVPTPNISMILTLSCLFEQTNASMSTESLLHLQTNLLVNFMLQEPSTSRSCPPATHSEVLHMAWHSLGARRRCCNQNREISQQTVKQQLYQSWGEVNFNITCTCFPSLQTRSQQNLGVLPQERKVFSSQNSKCCPWHASTPSEHLSLSSSLKKAEKPVIHAFFPLMPHPTWSWAATKSLCRWSRPTVILLRVLQAAQQCTATHYASTPSYNTHLHPVGMAQLLQASSLFTTKSCSSKGNETISVWNWTSNAYRNCFQLTAGASQGSTDHTTSRRRRLTATTRASQSRCWPICPSAFILMRSSRLPLKF